MQPGLVSVILPVFNRADYVGETLDSILAQSYANLEIVAINDGSEDDSLSILRQYAETDPDRIIVIDQKNQGQARARNNAIGVSRGEFIAFLDSDDLWLPDKLEKQIPLFTDNVGMVYCAIYNIDETGKVLGTEFCDERVRGRAYGMMLVENRMTGGTVVLSREALDTVGVFDPELNAAENWDLWIRVSERFRLELVNEPLAKYRKHPGNMSKDGTLMLEAVERIVSKHCRGPASSSEIAEAFRTAQANYQYRRGVHYFSRGSYALARDSFIETLHLRPGYKDSRTRLLRTYLGRRGNAALSALGQTATRFRSSASRSIRHDRYPR